MTNFNQSRIEERWELHQSEEEASTPEPLPPRRTAHPSSNEKWTRRFYGLLVFLFVVLIGFLTWWGFKIVKV